MIWEIETVCERGFVVDETSLFWSTICFHRFTRRSAHNSLVVIPTRIHVMQCLYTNMTLNVFQGVNWIFDVKANVAEPYNLASHREVSDTISEGEAGDFRRHASQVTSDLTLSRTR